jgi:hypothetical protein
VKLPTPGRWQLTKPVQQWKSMTICSWLRDEQGTGCINLSSAYPVPACTHTHLLDPLERVDDPSEVVLSRVGEQVVGGDACHWHLRAALPRCHGTNVREGAGSASRRQGLHALGRCRHHSRTGQCQAATTTAAAC